MTTQTPKYEVVLSRKLKNDIGLHILEGEFADLLLSIRFKDDPLANGEMEVEYYIVNLPKTTNIERVESNDFSSIFNKIITEILEGVAIDSPRNDDIEALDTQ